jgi:SAM-dependent methyltransferase
MLKFRIGLSKGRRRLPLIYISSYGFGPYRIYKILKILWKFRNFKEVENNEEYTIFQGKNITLKILNSYPFPGEWDIWEKYYIPPFSLKGKTVLDVGAGCGETVFLFFLHGAKKVIAIEPNVKAVKYLKENAKKNNWNVKIISEKFSLKHLNLDYDFMKMDGEGCEKLLLKLPKIEKPSVIDVHGKKLFKKFIERGWIKLYSKNNTYLCYNRGSKSQY